MHPAWYIIKFTLEVGYPTHSTELMMLTRGQNLVEIKGSYRPDAHQRVLVVVISEMLKEVSHGHLGQSLRDLVPEVVVI